MVNILVADDTRGPRFTEAFPKENVRVEPTVQRAVKAVKETKFDVIFLDYEFEQPGLSGTDVAFAITGSINKTTPVVVITNLPKYGHRLLNYLVQHKVEAEYIPGECSTFLGVITATVQRAKKQREDVAFAAFADAVKRGEVQ